MSRIGRSPIDLPEGVTVTVEASNLVTVKGPLGTLSEEMNKDMTIAIEDKVLTVARPSDKNITAHFMALHVL